MKLEKEKGQEEEMNMVKCGCGAILGPEDKFCPGCGAKSVAEEIPATAGAAAQDMQQNYSGKRGGSETVGKTRVYYGMAGRAEEIAQAMQDHLVANGYDPRVNRIGSETVIKVKRANLLRWITGTNQCLTVRIGVKGDNLVISLGGESWADKVVALVIGWFMFGILWLFAGYGAYKQYTLKKEAQEEMNAFIASMR